MWHDRVWRDSFIFHTSYGVAMIIITYLKLWVANAKEPKKWDYIHALISIRVITIVKECYLTHSYHTNHFLPIYISKYMSHTPRSTAICLSHALLSVSDIPLVNECDIIHSYHTYAPLSTTIYKNISLTHHVHPLCLCHTHRFLYQTSPL